MTTNAIKPLGQMPLDRGPVHQAAMPFSAEVYPDYEYRALRSYTEDCLARLRVAVAQLDEFSTCPGSTENLRLDSYSRGHDDALTTVKELAREALAAIGPLPTERSKETI